MGYRNLKSAWDPLTHKHSFLLTPNPFSPPSYTPHERRALRQSIMTGEDPVCPKCLVSMDIRSIPPRPDVAYVRNRAWLTCSSCGGAVVVDR